MASISELREALKGRLQTVPGLRTYDVMPPKPEPPAAAIALRTGTYGQSFDGADMLLVFDCYLYVAPGDLMRAQRTIDAYLSPTGALSIKEALESDPHLGGLSDWVRVVGWQAGVTLVDSAGTQLLAMSLQTEVMS
jgi:hypothetical protein